MEKVKIIDFCNISNGFAFKSDKYISENGARVIRITNVQKGKIVDNDPKLYPFSELDKLEAYKIFEGDILMSLTGNVGRVGRFPKELLPAYINQRVCRVMPKNEKLDTNFLFHFLNSDVFENEAIKNSAGAAQLNLSTKWLGDFEIPLPPLATQQRIAAILDQADAIIQNNRAIVQKYDALTQSLFLDMFGDPVKNEKGWKLVSAERHIDLLTGFAFKSELYSKNPNHIRLCGGLIIMPWGIEWDKSNKWDISNSDNLDKYQLEVDDIVMAMDRPWIGSGFKIAQIKEEDLPSLLVQRTARIRSNDFNSKFLFHFYKSSAFERHAKPTETTVPHISPKDIKSYLLFDVPIMLQNQFAERVAVIEAQKEQAQLQLAKSEELFASLLQRAFKGELS